MVMDHQSKTGKGHCLTFGLLKCFLLRCGCLYLLVGVTDNIDLFPGVGHVWAWLVRLALLECVVLMGVA